MSDLPSNVRARRIALPARGGELAAYDLGPQDQRIAVVFSHANGFNARTYLSILAPVAERARILAFDLRGHGLSSLPTDHQRDSWNDLRDDLLALLTAEDLSDVVLAGHSMGATTSLLASALAPERVRSLALFEPVIMPAIASGEAANSPLVQGALKRRRAFASRADVEAGYAGRGAFRAWSPQMLKDYVADGFRDTAEGVELSCAPEWEYSNFVHQAHDARGALKASRCPVRIVRAANNSTCRMDPEEAEALAPDRVRMQTIADTTHFLPMEEPGVVAATLRELIG